MTTTTFLHCQKQLSKQPLLRTSIINKYNGKKLLVSLKLGVEMAVAKEWSNCFLEFRTAEQCFQKITMFSLAVNVHPPAKAEHTPHYSALEKRETL